MVLGFSSGFWVDSGYRGIFESSFSAFSDLKFKFFYTCGFGGFAPSALLPPHTLRALLLLRPWIWDLNFSLLLSRSRQRFINYQHPFSSNTLPLTPILASSMLLFSPIPIGL
jgi:hypothetical protein